MVYNCGNCHYFRRPDDLKAFAEDGEGRCLSPWQERDTRSADQTCEHWAAREPERLRMPPSEKRKMVRHSRQRNRSLQM